MKNIYKKLIISCLAIAAFFTFTLGVQAVTLNQTNISLPVGQSQTVYASNLLGSLYVSYNSNPNIATISVSGSAVNIYGVANGNTTATICDNSTSYNCSSIYITVSGYYNNNGYNNGYNNYNNNTGLNISNLTLSTGSSATISSSNNYNYNGNNGLYVSNNSNPSVASVSSSSNISGCYAGNIYSVTTGQPCNGNQYYQNSSYYNSYIPGCYAGNQYSITTGQPCNGGVNNGASGSVVISALNTGSDTITLCQSSSNVCNTIYLTVTGYATPQSYYYNSMPLTNPYYSTPSNSSYYSTPYNYNNNYTPYNYNNNNYPQTSPSGIPIIYSSSIAN